jgi:predicted ester cyclase
LVLLAYYNLSGAYPSSSSPTILLGLPGAGVGIPEAVLWVLLGVMLLGEARLRALSNAWRRVAEENRCKARRLYEEGLGRGDLSVVDELSSEDFRDLRHGVSGGQGMRRVVLALRESFPDLAVSIEEQEAKEDVVRTRLRLSGTDRGGVLWFMPTGRRATFSATFEDRFSGGRLVEHNGSTDTEGLLRQLGHPKEEELPGQ